MTLTILQDSDGISKGIRSFIHRKREDPVGFLQGFTIKKNI